MMLLKQLNTHVLSKQVIDDPSGNSFIENPLAPDNDPLLSVDHYQRTFEQDKQLGVLDSGDKCVSSSIYFDYCYMCYITNFTSQ